MIAKGKAISHGKNALEYALRENKAGKFFASNLVEGMEAKKILKEFDMVQQYNSRCRNKFLRFEIGIAPQDEKNLTNVDLFKICRRFSKRMGLADHQWIACTHKDTDNLHIHLIANRINIDNVVYDTSFVSNKASKVAEQIAREMGLTIANEVHKAKEYQKQQSTPERLRIKEKLQNIAYAEFRNKHPDPNAFLWTLKNKHNIDIEPVKNKQGKTYGLRFKFEGQTFKASEIGKEFGLRSLYNHFGLQIKGQSSKAQHLKPKPQMQQTPSNTGSDILSSALEAASGIFTFQPSGDDYQEEAFANRMEYEERQRQIKNKKKRGRRM